MWLTSGKANRNVANAVAWAAIAIAACQFSMSRALHAQELVTETLPSLETTKQLIASIENRTVELAKADRERLLKHASQNGISGEHRERLIYCLFLSLQESATRSAEAAAYAPTLRAMAAAHKDDAERPWYAVCIAFSFESPTDGARYEQEEQARIAAGTSIEQLEFINALAFTHWVHAEERLHNLKRFYESATVGDAAREAILSCILHAMVAKEIDMQTGMLFYRDVAKLESHSMRLNKRLLQNIAEFTRYAGTVDLLEK